MSTEVEKGFVAEAAEAEPIEMRHVGPDGIGGLHVPPTFRLHHGRVDLLIHFHGGPNALIRAAEDARLTSIVASVSLGGLSSAYERPFSQPDLFRRIVDGALEALVCDRIVPDDAKLGRVYVSSFSAGFGAVRAILREPEHFNMITGIVMADSLYCGYDGPAENHKLDDRKMADFRRFASAAAKGDKFMLLTHSAQVPNGYASTTETADDLIGHVGARRRLIPHSEGAAWLLESVADKGGFHVRGYAGGTGADHGNHLRHLADSYMVLPISPGRN